MVKEVAFTKSKKVPRPLAPATYLWRNAGKTVPLTGVIFLAVMLVAGIVSLINSIPLSIRTIYDYTRYFVAVSPRGDADLTPRLYFRLAVGTPVPIERIVKFRGSSAQVKSIVGKWPFLVMGLYRPDMIYFLNKVGSKGLIGRLPEKGKPEAVISEPIARNLGLTLGSTLLSPTDQDNYSPFAVKVVGIAQTKEWLMLNDLDYQRENHFPPIDNIMAFARNPGDQGKLDHWTVSTFKGARAMVFAHFILERQTEDDFRTLYTILDIVIGALSFVITVMMSMLINIYLSQRIVEFGLLQAIGYTKRQLLSRVMRETLWVVLLGWVCGLLVTYLALRIANQALMYPHAYALETFDPVAFKYTAPMPLCILAAAVLTILLRFRRFDPVAIVERRLV